MPEMDKTYDPKLWEDRLYAEWEGGGLFHDDPDEGREPYTIVIPPPNITSQLHIGHALNNTLQDILIRFRRMQGRCTLWMPGTDHASIATEVKIKEALRAEDLTKQDVGREAFLGRAWKWYEKYGGIIIEQLKKLGCSCDWSRLRFTMDDGCSRAVREVFVRLYEKGLIYRGNRLINWCPECRTALSDAEVEYEEAATKFWHIRYPLKDGSGFIEVATTRPETMLGDTAVAVNPADERYASMVGKTVILPIMDREIPIIADSYVEKEFGTGAVKITPAHDPNDYEMALRHGLPMINIMNPDGTLNENAGPFAALSALEGRKRVAERLKELGVLVKIEDYNHNVGTCQRCHTTVEPLISEQWFVAMKTLAEPALEVVRNGRVKFVPQRYEKTYFNWMENIRDWCISRQLWWGHRIPAWYCPCGETIVAREEPKACPKCGSTDLRQDESVLDTWFSSGLWPFSTLGWPDKTRDLEYFYPTNVLVTAYDIIFFWVARMIFLGLEFMGDIPFDTVLITGLVRDAEGRKMSKSLGNGIDPLDVIAEFGADALRFSLTAGVAAGSDQRYFREKVESARNFANKIWNASRFVLMNLEVVETKPIGELELDATDKWMLAKLARAAREVTANIEEYELGLAAQKVYDFIWSDFCDWYIEMAKVRLYGGDEVEKQTAASALVCVLRESLKLLHPFMPFVTEAVWRHLPGDAGSIMKAEWLDADIIPASLADEEAVERAKETVTAVRAIRTELKVPASRKPALKVAGDEASLAGLDRYIVALAGLSSMEFMPQGSAAPKGSVSAVCAAGMLYLPLGELVDVVQELARAAKEQAALSNDMASLEAKLANPGFTAKAPANVVEAERQRLAVIKEKLERIGERIRELQEV
jgi:valyl-tRNA synthetase